MRLDAERVFGRTARPWRFFGGVCGDPRSQGRDRGHPVSGDLERVISESESVDLEDPVIRENAGFCGFPPSFVSWAAYEHPEAGLELGVPGVRMLGDDARWFAIFGQRRCVDWVLGECCGCGGAGRAGV